MKIILTLSEIGGIDENGEAIVVEIGESKYFNQRYNRGQTRNSHWLFGGCERASGKCFLVKVENRTAATLQAEIGRHVLPGTHIVSDGWASYANISGKPLLNISFYVRVINF